MRGSGILGAVAIVAVCVGHARKAAVSACDNRLAAVGESPGFAQPSERFVASRSTAGGCLRRSCAGGSFPPPETARRASSDAAEGLDRDRER